MIADTTTKRVLIVDDDPNLAQLLMDGLDDRRGHYEFMVALEPKQALETARRYPIDLLITDFAMPEVDGLTLIDSIRQTSPNMSVILMTAYATEQLEARAADKGVDQFMMKPFRLTDIRQVVRGILERIERTAPAAPAPEQIQQELFKHIHQLVNDTGARCAFLISLDGAVVEAAGDLNGLDVQVMATLMAANFAAVTEIARMLGNPRSFDAINHESKVDNIYTCAIGANHLLVIVFGWTVKPGTIWYYAKKMIEPLTDLLDKVKTDDSALALDFGSELDNALFDGGAQSTTTVIATPAAGSDQSTEGEILTLAEAIERGLLRTDDLNVRKDQL